MAIPSRIAALPPPFSATSTVERAWRSISNSSKHRKLLRTTFYRCMVLVSGSSSHSLSTGLSLVHVDTNRAVVAANLVGTSIQGFHLAQAQVRGKLWSFSTHDTPPRTQSFTHSSVPARISVLPLLTCNLLVRSMETQCCEWPSSSTTQQTCAGKPQCTTWAMNTRDVVVTTLWQRNHQPNSLK